MKEINKKQEIELLQLKWYEMELKRIKLEMEWYEMELDQRGRVYDTRMKGPGEQGMKGMKQKEWYNWREMKGG